MNKSVIGVTIGDPGGIGPEIIEKALAQVRSKSKCTFRIIGTVGRCKPGSLTKASAQKALSALNQSARLLQSGKIQAVINAPISKANIHPLGFHYPGQTEFYASTFGLSHNEVTMMMTSPKLKVSLVSTHCSLRNAIQGISKKTIHASLDRTLEVLIKMGIKQPRIAVAGLNPHAGENGMFGQEEKKMIRPALQSWKSVKEVEVTGPHVPDVVFREAYQGKFDAVICMFHDQGLIPFKLVAFDSGVNLTLGLPVWRCSPDHGTAVDIAGQGIASPRSLISACRLMEKLLSTKHK
ncbi:MAG: 4-hydroxythreonine-4-phosphate dehydrogenase PdxA [Verrucomicrobiota bacterium]